MSNRTANANKAIAARWTEEQHLVNDGKGTRDWTPEQQHDILDRGKAYDDNGKAFEGHHMKSVERYPEYQGDPENIQFLSRPEHIFAHNGSFQNHTNGCFHPSTGTTIDFGDNEYKPCEIIVLSDPIVVQHVTLLEPSMETDSSTVNFGDSSQLSTEDVQAKELKSEATKSGSHIKTLPSVNRFPRIKGNGFYKGLIRVANSVKEFADTHPELTEALKVTGIAIAGYLFDRVTSSSRGPGAGDRDYTHPTDSHENTCSNVSKLNFLSGQDCNAAMKQEGCGKGSPKSPHDTSGYTRKRYGKVERVQGYSTGEKRNK